MALHGSLEGDSTTKASATLVSGTTISLRALAGFVQLDSRVAVAIRYQSELPIVVSALEHLVSLAPPNAHECYAEAIDFTESANLIHVHVRITDERGIVYASVSIYAVIEYYKYLQI